MKNDNFKNLLEQCKQVNALQIRIVEMEAEKEKSDANARLYQKEIEREKEKFSYYQEYIEPQKETKKKPEKKLENAIKEPSAQDKQQIKTLKAEIKTVKQDYCSPIEKEQLKEQVKSLEKQLRQA